MVSADGLKTWFDYQLLFLGLAIVFVLGVAVIGWAGESLPAVALSSVRTALAVTVVGSVLVGVLFVVTARYLT